MAAPLLVLHAGPHKTGTTALQLRLGKARAELLERGFDYPELGLSQFAHHRLNGFLRGDSEAAGDVTEAALRALAATRRNVILSSEDLVYQPPENLERLRSLFEGYQFQIILFIRTPVELWPSHWQELVKHGRTESLLEYLGWCLALNTSINVPHANPGQQAARFAQVFGRRRLRLFCYNNILADGIDLFEFFVETILHVPPLLPRLPTITLNGSLSPEVVELLRSLNERYHHHHGRSPGSSIAAAHRVMRAEIESDPDYGAFCESFARHARSMILDSTNEIFRRHDRRIIRQLGDRIENLAGPEQLFATEFSRTVQYATPYWADRFGFGAYLDALLARLMRDT